MPQSSKCILSLAVAGMLAGIAWGAAARGGNAPAAGQQPADAAQARITAARETYAAVVKRIKGGEFAGEVAETWYLWSRRWMESENDAAGGRAGRREALAAHLERMKDLEQTCAAMAKTGQWPHLQALAGTYFRLEAETQLGKEPAR